MLLLLRIDVAASLLIGSYLGDKTPSLDTRPTLAVAWEKMKSHVSGPASAALTRPTNKATEAYRKCHETTGNRHTDLISHSAGGFFRTSPSQSQQITHA